jgi:hypothetical protein
MKNYWNLKLSSSIGLLILFFVCNTTAAQFSETDKDTFARQEKYIFPIKPGTPASLAGTMGELRNTHFHSGIDIRTNNEVGWPVLAVKSGYIARAGVSGSSYGNVLYLNHPDGNTTLYAHLDRFNGPIADFILNERYNRKTSNIDLTFPYDQFPVKQGDTIGFAGNTGASNGAHLHFDIRRENIALDPLKFGFTEVKDNAPPVATKVALKTLDIHSRVNDQFGRHEFYLIRNGNTYSLANPILAYGTIGIELMGFDQVDNPRFKCGINFIEVLVDDEKIFEQQIEEVNTSDARGIYALMDYKVLRTSGKHFYKLYIDDANKLNYYEKSPGKGFVRVNPEKISSVKIIMRDLFGNKSEVNFKLKPSPPEKEVVFLEAAKKSFSIDIEENTLMLTTQPCPKQLNQITVHYRGEQQPRDADYYSAGKAVYLFDLRKGIPDSLTVCGQPVYPNIKYIIPHGVDYTFYNPRVDVQLSKAALFDTLYFGINHRFETDSSELFTIGNSLIPLAKTIAITLKPLRNYGERKNTRVYRVLSKGYSYEGGQWENGQITFTPREFGTFTILKDDVPPTITVLAINNHTARFRIRDNLSGIAKFEATINGNWLLLNHDAKTNTIATEKLNKKQPLRGLLELTVTDNAGNKKTIQQRIP